MKIKMNRKGKTFVISLAAIISAVSGMIIQHTQEPQIYYNGSEFREAVAFEMQVDEAAVKIPENINSPPESNMSENENTVSDENVPDDVSAASGEDIPDTAEINENNTENDRININTASAEELMSLNGIGEKLSQRIIAYRTENGGFHNIQDIMKVSGIGNKKFEAVKDKITV